MYLKFFLDVRCNIKNYFILFAFLLLDVAYANSKNDSLFIQYKENKNHFYDKYENNLDVLDCEKNHASNPPTNFEPDIVRPIALGEKGKYLYVANSVTNCLEIFDVSDENLKRVYAIPVGLSPVAVAVADENEVWVVNQHSDSVSVVDIQGAPFIKRTISVGDEPRDIVFAGKDRKKAFISTAHRGQHHQNFNLQDIRNPGIGRADVWVYDREAIGKGLGGEPVEILNLFSDTPRALSVGQDGRVVYAAAYLSGNQTTTIFASDVDKPKNLPNTSIDGYAAPSTGLIVKYDGFNWIDELGNIWDEKINFNLPDKDVFVINAESDNPYVIKEIQSVGTTIFNMVENPISGELYVSNTDAQNQIRFEGSGERGTTLRGKFIKNQITVLKGDSKQYVDLNPHVDFDIPMGTELSKSEKLKSISQPMQMEVTKDGKFLYLAAYGSAKIVKIRTSDLHEASYSPEKSIHIPVSGGIAGLALSKNERIIYAYSRFKNVITKIDAESFNTLSTKKLFNNEPYGIAKGREFLYDAFETSGNGTVSCGSCHIFGDMDALAWDLGNPDSPVVEKNLALSPGSLEPSNSEFFHPLKGPMVTQTLRGISHSGSMHWRGDKTGLDGNGNDTLEEAAFKEFNGAFVSLLGRGNVLNETQLNYLTEFGLSIQSPPNPIRRLNNSLTKRQKAARFDYFNTPLDRGIATCNSCHVLDPKQNLFGTDKLLVNDGAIISQDIKVPHLRNMYQKVGMFGTGFLSDEFVGDQVRGFGYIHDGTFATLDDFFLTFDIESEDQAHRMTEFIMAYPSENSPIVGQQVTVSKYSSFEELKQLFLMMSRSTKGECDLKIHDNSQYRAWSKISNGHNLKNLIHRIKQHRALYKPTTFTCYPKGSDTF